MKHCILSPRAGGFRALAKTLFLGLLLAEVGGWLATPLHAAERRWTGSSSGLWSNPNNWNPVGTPQEGEDLIFTSGGDTMFNDLVGVVARRLFFHSDEWQLTGNELVITNSIAVGEINDSSTETIVTIDCPLTLGGSLSNIFFTISWGSDDPVFDNPNQVYFRGPIDLNGHNLLVNLVSCGCGVDQFVSFSGVISGNGNVTVDVAHRPGIVEIGGPQPNTFIGTLGCHGGVMLNKENGPAVNTTLDVAGPVVVKRSGQIAPGATVRIAPSGQLRLEGHDETFTDLDIGSYRVFGGNDPEVVLDTQGATLTLLGNIRSRAFSPSFTSGPVTPILRGSIALPNGPHIFDIYGSQFSFYGLDLQAQIIGGGGFSKFGDAALLLPTSNTFSGSVSVNDGIVEARNRHAFGSANRGVTLTDGSVTLRNVFINETLFVRGTQPVTANSAGSLLTGIGLSGWLGRIELNTNLVVRSVDDPATSADSGLCLIGGPVVGPGGLEFLGSRNQYQGSGFDDPSTYTGVTRVLCELLHVSAEEPFLGPVVVGGGFSPLHELRAETTPFDFSLRAPEVTFHPNGLLNLNGRDTFLGQLIFHGGRVVTSNATLHPGGIISNPTNVTATIEGNVVLNSIFTFFDIGDGPALPDLAINGVIADGPNAGAIIKRGLGELLLNGANTYSGANQVQAGVLHIQNASSLGTTGAGTTVFDGGTLQVEFVGALAEPLNLRGAGRGDTNGALNLLPATGVQAGIVLGAAATVRVDSSFGILSGIISGTGSLTKIGPGTLQIGGGSGGNNTYSGDTLVSEGELVLNKPSGIAAVPSHLVIGGGPLGSTATVRHFSGSTIIGSVTVNRAGLWDLNGQSEGWGIADLQGRPPLTLNNGGDVQTGAGTIFLPVGGDVAVNPGNIGGSVISGRIGLDSGLHRFAVGSVISVLGRLELDVTAVVAFVSGTAGITKTGFGTMRLAGNNTFNGDLNINEGRVLAANSLAFGSSTSGTFVNSNASLALDAGVFPGAEMLTLNSDARPALETLTSSNNWGGIIQLSRHAHVRVNDPAGVLSFNGPVTGPGGLTKLGQGGLNLGGPGANSYAGLTVVSNGVVEVTKPAGVLALGGDVIIGSGVALPLFNARLRAFNAGHLLRTANVSVHTGGLFDVDGSGVAIRTVSGDGHVEISPGASLAISNDVPFEFAGILIGAGGLSKQGAGKMTLSGASLFSGRTDLLDGTLQVDGGIANSFVQLNSPARLQGRGRVGPVNVAGPDAVVAPGASPGILRCKTLDGAEGRLEMELDGTTPGTSYDQLAVEGTVMLSGITLNASLNFASATNDHFIIISNDSSDAVVGTFSGLPQGATLVLSNQIFLISYTGGDGNDVVLTHVPNQPPTVRVLTPTHGAFFAPGGNVLLSARVTDATSTTPPQAEFFIDGQSVGVDASSPYALNWSATPGAHVLRVTATDSFGLSTTSAGRLFFVTDPIVPIGAQWRYLDDGTDQGTAWHQLNFNDHRWLIGNGEFGFGDGDETTVINGGTAQAPRITHYFRKRLTNDFAAMNYAAIQLLRDDGAVVYLNSQEIARANLPQPPAVIAFDTLALTNVGRLLIGIEFDEPAVDELPIPLSAFASGTNLLAVELHQSSVVSPASRFDLSFDLALFAFAYDPGTVLTIEAVNNKALVRWPDYLPDWELEQSTDLATWVPVTEPPKRTDGFFVVTVSMQAHEFFRLRQTPPP